MTRLDGRRPRSSSTRRSTALRTLHDLDHERSRRSRRGDRCAQREALAAAVEGWREAGRRVTDDAHPRRLPPRPGAGRAAATSTSSTSKASRRGRSTTGAPRSSPLRDVAGLMRSFDYAAAATLDPKDVAAAALSPEHARGASSTRFRDGAQAGLPRRLLGRLPAELGLRQRTDAARSLPARKGGL